MQSLTDLQTIKKKVYLSYFEDGLWDMLLGIYLIGWGFSLAYDLVAVTGGIWVAIYFIVLGLKRRITYPRSGYIKIPEARKNQMKMVLAGVVLFLFGLVFFGLMISGNRPDWLGEYELLMLGGLMVVTVAVLGFWWHVTRWYLFAVLMLTSFMVQQWTIFTEAGSFFIPGGLIGLYGLYLFIRFLRRYPKVETGVTDDIS